jgi:hypothetical protein
MLMLGQTSGKSPSQKQGKRFISIYFREQFSLTAQKRVELSPLDLYVCRHIKNSVYSAPIEYEETLHQRTFVSVKLFGTTPALLKLCHIP